MTRPTTCYLSFAIDMDNNNLGTETVPRIEKRLHHLTILTFNPLTAYASWNFEDKEHQAYVRTVNESALLAASFMLAIWDHTVPSWGMPMEMKAAHDYQVPVVFLSTLPEGQKTPMYLAHTLTKLEGKGKLAKIGDSILSVLHTNSLRNWRLLNPVEFPYKRKNATSKSS